MIATIWEVWNDRNGDFNKSEDVFIRLALLCFEAVVLFMAFDKPLIDSLLFSTAVFFAFFDYLVAYLLIKNSIVETKQSWFEYLGKSSYMDKTPLWRKAGPWGRFFIKLVVLLAAVIIFIV
jgi:hypothetical protein